MNPFALTSTLVAVSCALTLAGGACSSSSTGSGVATTDGGASSDTGRPQDAVATQDHGSAVDAGAASDGGSSETDAAEDAGLSCAPPANKSAACGACVASSCEPAWCTCQEDPTVDDAGLSGCLHYVQCVDDCVASDAGSPTACLQTICAIAPTTTAEQHEGQAFVDCLVQYCAAQCVQ